MRLKEMKKLQLIVLITVMLLMPLTLDYLRLDEAKILSCQLQNRAESNIIWTSSSIDFARESLFSASPQENFCRQLNISSKSQDLSLFTSTLLKNTTIIPETAMKWCPSEVNKVVINETDLSVMILLNSTYTPGDNIRIDFFITNKIGTIKKIGIKLDIYYFNIKISSYQYYSRREYREGKTIHIFKESRLPMLTPPGKYILKFSITPEGRETKEASTLIIVRPNAKWVLSVITTIFLLLGMITLLKKHWKVWKEFSAGQKFILFAVIGIIISTAFLAVGDENHANNVSTLVYYLLLVGVLNIWIEYLKPKRDIPSIRASVSIFLFAGLIYPSGGMLTRYFSFTLFAVGVLMIFWDLKDRVKELGGETEEKTSPRIPEIEIIGETEDGFIIFRERSDENEG